MYRTAPPRFTKSWDAPGQRWVIYRDGRPFLLMERAATFEGHFQLGTTGTETMVHQIVELLNREECA